MELSGFGFPCNMEQIITGRPHRIVPTGKPNEPTPSTPPILFGLAIPVWDCCFFAFSFPFTSRFPSCFERVVSLRCAPNVGGVERLLQLGSTRHSRLGFPLGGHNITVGGRNRGGASFCFKTAMSFEGTNGEKVLTTRSRFVENHPPILARLRIPLLDLKGGSIFLKPLIQKCAEGRSLVGP